MLGTGTGAMACILPPALLISLILALAFSTADKGLHLGCASPLAPPWNDAVHGGARIFEPSKLNSSDLDQNAISLFCLCPYNPCAITQIEPNSCSLNCSQVRMNTRTCVEQHADH